ncbi:MAG: hypothetical protein ACPGVT_11900 [Maricaulaceae bacterium]
MAALYVVMFLLAWGLALLGATELVFDIADIESEAPLAMWQLLSSAICTGVMIGAVAMIAWAANRFLKVTYRNGFFIEGAAKACLRMGQGLTLFWLGLLLTESFMPWILTYNFPPAEKAGIEWFVLDAGFIALLAGVVLILMAQAMDEARAIDADNKQII